VVKEQGPFVPFYAKYYILSSYLIMNMRIHTSESVANVSSWQKFHLELIKKKPKAVNHETTLHRKRSFISLALVEPPIRWISHWWPSSTTV